MDVEKKMIRKTLLSLITCAMFAGMSSCLYKMPDEDDIRTVPTTNNPNVIKDTSPSLAPSIDY
jgi:hypothetical protein